MIASVRVTSVQRLATALAILGGATFASGQPAEAQVAPVPAPGVTAPGFPTPVEIAINILNSQILCQPDEDTPARARQHQFARDQQVREADHIRRA